MHALRRKIALALLSAFLFAPCLLRAQAGTSGLVTGTVTDVSGAVLPGASVNIHNALSGYDRTRPADASGNFQFSNLPFGTYTLTITQSGFQPATQTISVQSAVAISKTITLQIAAATQTVTVTSTASNAELQSNVSDQTDIGSALIDKLPLVSGSSGISAAITLASPGITADSNGMFHPLGEHSDTTYSIDGQPISDQQSKTFSNQVSINAVQSMQVIEGVIPAEYGDKASLVAKTTTKSGLGSLRPEGNFGVNYGSFGTTNANASLSIGNSHFGNFVTGSASNGGRYLDAPEIDTLHAHGNNESVFDRIDYAPNSIDTFHLNLTGSRSWFQVPNQYDQQAAGQDQRSQIFSYNIAPFWTRIFGQNGVLEVNPYLRQDNVHYYPSHDLFSDTPATLAQDRTLRNLGIKVDYSLSEGIHNAKFGADFNHTFLDENFGLGITSNTYNAVCVDSVGSPVPAPGITETSQCMAAGYFPNSNFQPGLLPYDLTRNGTLYIFHGRTDIKEQALYAQDQITWHNWQFLAGIRGDNYNGITSKYMAEPRAGITYNLTPTKTVLRVGYSRLMPTPYNENLIVSSTTGIGGLAQATGSFGQHALTPASRNQYDAGFEQSVTKHLLVDGEYFWKETKGDYDFDVLLNTPLTFPIQWRKSKIDGFDLRLTMPAWHGFNAYSVMGHSRSRFFGPERGGILFNNPNGLDSFAPFRIDHDQAFEQTSNVTWQPRIDLPWVGFTWRYDSGMVAGNAPYATDTTTPVSLTYLTPDQQQQIQLTCGNTRATLTAPLVNCAPYSLSSPLVTIPAPGTQNPDKNPARIAPRHLFDISSGWSNIFRRDRFKTDLNFSVTNLSNKVALYNFLSTFSGTHYVAPRAYTAGLTFNF